MSTAPLLATTAAAATDIGLVRQVNEDCVRLLQNDNGRAGLLAIVADGMGGHGHGDVASLMAVQSVAFAYERAPDRPVAQALREALEQANRAIFFAAQQDAQLRGMGTTCTAVAIQAGMASCAHVGDSRLYLLRGGALYTMTTDHSYVGSLVARGLMTAAEARVHEDRNVLLRALGTEPEVAIDCWQEPFPLCDGDRLLLCTDGLHGVATEDELTRIVTAASPGDACRDLIAAARGRGGSDNITVAVIHVRGTHHD